MKKIKGTTSMYALIGSPIKHSLSPEIYNFGFDYHGIDAVYLCQEIKEKNLNNIIKALKLMNIKGFNVTMPYKNAILPYVDKLSRLSKLSQSVNTIKLDDNGDMVGDMTDGVGFILALKSKGIDIKGSNIEIVGAGGAGRALSVAALVNGANKVILSNRDSNNMKLAIKLSDELSKYRGIKPLQIKKISTIEEYEIENDVDILVNATSIGMSDNPGSIINDISMLHSDMTVVDLVYETQKTLFMKQSKEANIHNIIGGKIQLLFQAITSFKWYVGLDYPINEYLNNLKRIVYLTGFMGAGKTTIGKRLGEALGVNFIDLDRYIEKNANLTVAEIFKYEKEMGFRKRESDALREIIDNNKDDFMVISTGGGTVLQDENFKQMEKTGYIINLDISFAEVIKRISANDKNRPMIYEKSIEDIGILYRYRADNYKKKANYSIYVDNRTIDSIAYEISGFISKMK